MAIKGSEDITAIIREAAVKARSESPSKPEKDLTHPVEWPVTCTIDRGLAGAIACETKVGYVNGTQGHLVYRGYDIFDLCEHATYEEVAYLLLHGNLPDEGELTEFKQKLSEYRYLPHTLRLIMGFPLEKMHPMAALRLGTNLMRQHQTERDLKLHDHASAMATVISSDDDSDSLEEELPEQRKKAFVFLDQDVNRPPPERARQDQREAYGLEPCYHLIAGAATLAAAIERIRNGRLPIEPDPELSHAANLLYMMTGRRPDPVEERIMDVALILHADHGMNASTFAAMVVASTLSDMYFSVGAGVAALNGPLHGGANEAVLNQLRDIGSPDNVDAWYKTASENKQRVMGFGHRVYKAYDPRARILGPLATYLAERSSNGQISQLLATAHKLEGRVVDDLGERKGIFPNVDFYSGMVYTSLGISQEMFTPLFAVSRVAGWTARVLEYMKSNRIFRPRAMYVGELQRPFKPLEER